VKRLSFLFFVVALLIAGVAIAAVVVRANGLLPTPAIAISSADASLTSN
jgi:hypothetical protein